MSDELTDAIRAKYGGAAERVRAATRVPPDACNPISSGLYGNDVADGVPRNALLASLGCGNPTALAELKPGDVVLDLGSGGGIDVLLSARRVGPTGRAYGIDSTPEMLSLAEANAAEAGASNVAFLEGDIENIPLPDESVDVLLSNCVINLAGDKGRVLKEAHRVLVPGGRFAVSDIVVRGTLPPPLRKSLEAWVGCVAGALEEGEFLTLLQEAGFGEPSIEPTRVYDAEDARTFVEAAGVEIPEADALAGSIMAAFVRASKPRRGDAETRSRRADAVRLRPSTAADLPAIERVLRRAHLPVSGIRQAHLLLAAHGDEVVGVGGIELHGADALLRSIAVSPTWRGQGLGDRIVRAALDDARRRGVRDVYLLTTTAADYFPRFGFAVLDRADVSEPVRGSGEFRELCPDSAVAMRFAVSGV